MMGEKANIFKARCLHGNHGRRCGGHKRGGQCALPGEISGFAIKLARSQGWDEEAREVSRSHSRPPREGRRTEQNTWNRNRALDEGKRARKED